MRFTERDDFINKVLGRVRFKYDHEAIRQELEEHIDDLTEELKDGGLESGDVPRRRLPPAPRPHPPSKTPRMSVTNPRRFRRADPTPSPPPTIAVEPPPQSSSQAVEEDATDQLPAEAEDPQADSSEYRPRKY